MACAHQQLQAARKRRSSSSIAILQLRLDALKQAGCPERTPCGFSV
jgi:hypothetical protein